MDKNELIKELDHFADRVHGITWQLRKAQSETDYQEVTESLYEAFCIFELLLVNGSQK